MEGNNLEDSREKLGSGNKTQYRGGIETVHLCGQQRSPCHDESFGKPQGES